MLTLLVTLGDPNPKPPQFLHIFTYSPGEVRSIVTNMSVCLSVRSHISKTAWPNFTKFSVHVDCGRGSVLLWRRFDTLCTSGFVNDVIFHTRGPMAHRLYIPKRQGRISLNYSDSIPTKVCSTI